MFACCDDTVFPMTARAFWPLRPTDKWQHRLSSRTPTGTELPSRKLTRSANRNPVESNRRCNRTDNKSKSPIKVKNKA